jgi:hypothetical protein
MRLTTIFVLIVAAGGAYHWWQGKNVDSSSGSASPNGFVGVEMPEGSARNTVLILTPPNCPSDEAERAEALAYELTQNGIPVVKSGSMSFAIQNPTSGQQAGVKRAVAVFNEGAPAVFVNGMAMSNPTAAQAIAEYRRARSGL